MNEHEDSDAFAQTLNSCRSLGYARGHESIRIFNNLFKSIEIYIYAKNKHPFASHPAANHSNAAYLRHRIKKVFYQ